MASHNAGHAQIRTLAKPVAHQPMKLINDVSANKLRGGYYTSEQLVAWAVERVVELSGRQPQTWLEPSAGDGAFVRGLDRAVATGLVGPVDVTAIELLEGEAARCRQVLERSALTGNVIAGSFFEWAIQSNDSFDALIGNPPYVRYQFVHPDDRLLAEELMRRLGLELRGVSNLWIPFTLASMYLLKPSAAFALVLPSELFSTVSGGQFRKMLVEDFSSIRLDLFPRDAFPDILQDVVIVSGIRAAEKQDHARLEFCEQHANGSITWHHTVAATPQSWLRYLLTEDEVWAFQQASQLPGVFCLASLAKIEVSIVTGANPFFTVDDVTVEKYSLQPWARPLLARTSDCPGLIFKAGDHEVARVAGNRCWLLDFSAERPAPQVSSAPFEYLRWGESRNLHTRFKCRIREPWYRVPQIRSGRLLLTKRAHHHHRLLLNEADVFTTDTIYRGAMLPARAHMAEDLVAGFQNSLTLLSSEVEGRTYGGGVLELVPSEIARLQVPLVPLGCMLPQLDQISRQSGGQRDATGAILAVTDQALSEKIPGYADLLPLLRSARQRLCDRRLNAPPAS